MNNTPDHISTKIISNPSHDSFKKEIERAPQVLTVNDVRSYFDIVLNLFATKVSYESGKSILISIRKLIRNDEIREIFIQEQFIDRLPFTNGNFSEILFDIMYDFIQLYPTAFDDTLCPLFGQLFMFNPQKALVIISYVAQHMEDFENPWPILDLLFYESKQFNNLKIGSQYITLLAYLCCTYEDYALARAENCWKKIYSMLNKNSPQVLMTGFDGLRMISKYYPNGPIPIDSIKTNIENDKVCMSILDFLVELPNDHLELRNPDLIKSLLYAAQKTNKATAILLKISAYQKNAEIILNQENWTQLNLPSLSDTLRIFLVIFSHKNLRPQLVSERKTFVNFLCRLVDIGKSGVLTIITTILRRVLIDQQFIDLLEETSFLHAFIATAKRIGDDMSMHSALLLVSTLAKIGFTPSYLEISATIANIIQTDTSLTKVACYVAAELNIYHECREVFEDCNLPAYFESKLKDPKMGQLARRFLDAAYR